MQLIKKDKDYRWLERTFLGMFFLAAFFLCTRIGYSDGDDAYFYQMAHSMGFFEYLKMRYVTWEGRMTSEAMTYISMYFGKGFWNVANAGMLTLFVAGLVQIVKKIKTELTSKQKVFLVFFMCSSVLLLGVDVIGYAGFWITGSTFYLWSVTAGIWAAVPLAELAFSPEAVKKRSFFYAIPCGFIAAMGLEQIAAVVITFGLLSIGYYFWRERKIYWPAAIQILIMIGGLIVLFISPGTDARSGQELEWMPEFETMSVPHHIFITGQWILSSFANQHKWLLHVILVLAVVRVWKSREESKKWGTWIFAILGTIGAVSTWLGALGARMFTELGMGVEEGMHPVIKTATLSSLTGQELFACIWQILLLILTGVILWYLGSSRLEKTVMILLLLASLASSAVMYFSPTMYVSGTRVMFVTAVMLWMICGILYSKFRADKALAGVWGYTFAVGVLNVAAYAVKVLM